jgi:putative FmdB family regulatory protein
MPLYEYQCQKCRRRFEKIQKINDPPCKKCSSCGGPLKKLLSSPAIQFKGNGFYITDYAKKSVPTGETKFEKSAATKAKTGDEKKPESKAEPMPTDKPRSD